MKKITILMIGLVIGFVFGQKIKQAFASGNLTACISHHGLIRVASASDKCRRNETVVTFGNNNVAPSGGFISDLANINLDGQNFNFHNLTNFNFSNSNLRNAQFRYSNLTGANFHNADMTSTNLDHAIFVNTQNSNSIKWYSCPGNGCTATTCPDGTLLQTDGGTCVGHLTF